MKILTIFILTVIFPFILMAQRGPYKFYSKEDSINHRHYDLILREGREVSIVNGKPKFNIIDSSYINHPVSKDSALKMIRQIPKFAFNTHEPTLGYCTLNQLKSSSRKDTITNISLAGKSIKKLPLKKIIKCKNLKEIEIIGTSIKKIPWLLNWRIFKLDSLKTLKIYNYDQPKPLKFSKNTHLTELVYNDSPFSPLPRKFQKLKNLKTIEFVRNDLRDSPNLKLNQFDQLKEINLSHNSLNISKLVVDTVYSLENIILSFNHLKEVPKEIGYFKNLKELQLAENEITSEQIHPSIGSLQKLELISFYKNDLDALPPFLFGLNSLKEFDINYNRVERIPSDIINLTQLERLFLSYNRILDLPQSIGELQNLKEIYLHHNRISYLPQSFCQLNNITDFHINNNYFTEFPSCILQFKKLEDLDISFNKISKIPSELKLLEELKLFWVRGIVFEASNENEAEQIKETIEYLIKNGVNVSMELDQDNI